MAITLNRFAVGDKNYVTKMNSNATLIEGNVNGLAAQIAAIGGGAPAGLDEIYSTSGIIGLSSFQHSLVSDTDISFTSGAVWHFGTKSRGRVDAVQNISFVGRSSGSYFVNIDTTGFATVSTISTPVAVYSLTWNNPGIEDVTRITNLLIDGDDYARSLSSLQFGQFDRIADRLSNIESTVGLAGQYAQVKVSGLTWDYASGRVRVGTSVVSTAGSSIPLSDDTTHYVDVDPDTGIVSFTTTGGFEADNIPIRLISAAGGVVVSNLDLRSWATVGGGSGGGNAISGTVDGVWKLYRGAVATVSDAALVVVRPDDQDVQIRFNETNDTWEFTNDGSTFKGIGSVGGLDIGASQNSRFTALSNQPIVLDQAERSSTGAPPFEELIMTAHISATTQAVLLRGYALELSSPSYSIASALGIRFFKDDSSITNEPGGRILASPVSRPVMDLVLVPVSNQRCVFAVDASSDLTATVKVALVGAWDSVQGVGTQYVSAMATSGTDLTISCALSTTDILLSEGSFSGSMNRGLITHLEVSSTLPSGDLYDVEFYGSDPGDANQLQFIGEGIDGGLSPYITGYPWLYRNLKGNNDVHLRVSNNGASATFITLHWQGERFA